MDEVRLNKYIAGANVCSRRKADELISEGKVKVNGKIVMELGVKVDPSKDVVELDGKKLDNKSKLVYIMLNKPAGCVTTASDQFGRKTVMDYVRDIGLRVFSVGRLDYSTSGLLILTNDGEFANKLIHPKYKIEKTYIAKVTTAPDIEALKQLRRGVIISDTENETYKKTSNTGMAGKNKALENLKPVKSYKTTPAKVNILESGKDATVLEITVHEGRNRQIRKMCEAVNCPVISLHRIKVGALSLGDLKIGTYRYLTEAEVRRFFN